MRRRVARGRSLVCVTVARDGSATSCVGIGRSSTVGPGAIVELVLELTVAVLDSKRTGMVGADLDRI